MSEIPAPSPITLPAPLARALDGVRSRWLAVRIAEFAVLLIAILALAWVAQAIADRLLDLTWKTRAILLAIEALVALVLLVIFVALPLWRRLTRAQAALLVERELPHFRTSLISAVELGNETSPVPTESRALVRELLADVSRKVEHEELAPNVIHPRRLFRFIWIMCIGVAIAGIAYSLAQPLSPLLLKRIFLSNAQFPAETEVLDVSGDLSVIEGSEAALKAEAHGVAPSSGKLLVNYDDGRLETLTISPTAGQPSQFAFTVKNVRQPFGYRFELNDGVGAQHRVAVRFPPALKEVKFTQIYPKYTKLPDAVMPPGSLRLLAGSKLRIEATATAALQSAELEIKGGDEPATLAPSGKDKQTLQTELTVPETGWKSLSIHLEDASHERSVNDPIYRVELITDKPPVAILITPKKETTTVVPTSKVAISWKVSDDFGLRRAEFRYRVFRPSPGGTLDPAEGSGFPGEMTPDGKSSAGAFTWDLSKLQPAVTAGCSISIYAEAEDAHTTKGRTGVIVKSIEKTLMIVTEEQKRQELIEALGERAKDLERLYDIQRQMNEKTDNSLR